MRKISNRKTTKSVGSRTNIYSEDSDMTQSDLQRTVDGIAEKVDTETGRVESGSSKGVEGSFRAVKEKNEWYLEIKTSDGWIKSQEGAFKIKDKNG